MTSPPPPGGRWVYVTLPNGAQRADWVPTEGPPSPDGQPGRWHVVTDAPDSATRWEWWADRPPQPPLPIVDASATALAQHVPFEMPTYARSPEAQAIRSCCLVPLAVIAGAIGIGALIGVVGGGDDGAPCERQQSRHDRLIANGAAAGDPEFIDAVADLVYCRLNK